VRPQADRDGVGGEKWIEVVVRELEAGEEQQVVARSGPLRLGVDLLEVGAMIRRHDPARPLPRRHERVVVPVHVVGDDENVEARPPVQIHELRQRERSVAPRRVRVELAEERLWPAAHLAPSVPPRSAPWSDSW
jgi:hypothetical protein